ncbi:MAG: protein-glutamate O-methyltransferase CheR [Burkholderiales bacterium]|nr:protein-glutamate O-methyltransferase CheR [Burkholderiales bacterium]
MEPTPITDKEFGAFRAFLYDATGISLSDAKKALVGGRLAKRLKHHGVSTYGEYYRLISSGTHPDESRMAVDLLTTNETYFFREPKHFAFLESQLPALASSSSEVCVWSAASSSGEEGYSIAMVLAKTLGVRPWQVVGTDISSRVVARARTGHYAIERASHIPKEFLARYCRKGVRSQEGTFLIARDLRERVRFLEANLNGPLPDIGEFQFVFLRNVMIYFDLDTKRQIVRRIAPLIRPGGFLFVGHSETLNDISDAFMPVQPSIYRKP